VAGARDKLEELQQKNKDSFETASIHLTSIREQSQQAEERVQKVMAGLESRLEAGFERLLSLDHSILGELFAIKAVVFYASCAVVIFICTTSRYTQRIRIHLFIGLGVTCYVEAHALYFSNWLFLTDPLTMITLIRKFFMGTVLASLVAAGWRFRDYNELSYEIGLQNQTILREIMKHLRQKAVADNLDCEEDSMFVPSTYQIPAEPKNIHANAFFPIVFPSNVPPLEQNDLEYLNPAFSRTQTAFNERSDEEDIDDQEILHEGCREKILSSVIEEPSKNKAYEPDAPLSHRCPAIAKSSGVQCRNSARKCGAHRMRY